MRFLIDSALSPVLAAELNKAGHEAKHARDLGLRQADDESIMRLAVAEERVVVSADTDFGTLLALHEGRLPSVILFRRGSPRRPDQQARLLLANLPGIDEELRHGAIVTFQSGRLRVRRLPLRRSG
jgi:predicted nuclease of predicted toxin-antitoxin system